MEDLYAFIRSAWVVWMMALFIAILLWVLWPSNREKFRRAANIPLADEDDPPAAAPRRRNGEDEH